MGPMKDCGSGSWPARRAEQTQRLFRQQSKILGLHAELRCRFIRPLSGLAQAAGVYQRYALVAHPDDRKLGARSGRYLRNDRNLSALHCYVYFVCFVVTAFL
jgi:hypothetical protein